MAKTKRKKSLVGWICTENPVMRFDGFHSLAELAIAPIYKTKRGVYFNEHITEHDKYKHNPRKVRITLEEI